MRQQRNDDAEEADDHRPPPVGEDGLPEQKAGEDHRREGAT